jgi:excisionase family DNA binding protein
MRPTSSFTVSVPEAARILGIGRNTAYVAARRGDLPTVRIGGRIVVPVHRLVELLDSAERGCQEGAGVR